MDQTTQQNAALVEQASAAAQSLQQEAATLARTVGAFRIGGGAADTAAPVQRPAAAAKPAIKPAAAPAVRPALAKPAAPKAAAQPRPARKETAATAGDGWEEF
jgi:hypothetical protein